MTDNKRVDVEQFEGHTPGEWRIYKDVDVTKPIAIRADIRPEYLLAVAECYNLPDASLIAAAPELLDEVLRLRAENEALKAENKRLAENITKARFMIINLPYEVQQFDAKMGYPILKVNDYLYFTVEKYEAALDGGRDDS